MLSESRFFELYHRQQESGLKVKDFCFNEGIAESTFYYWVKKLRKKSSVQNFIPLVVKSSGRLPAKSYTKNFLSVQGTENVDTDILFELVYPNGTKLRIKHDIDLAHLRTLICLFD